MKFEIKDILWPAFGFFCALTAIAWLWISLYEELPAFELILLEICVILYFGSNQSYQITKILNIHKKDKKRRA